MKRIVLSMVLPILTLSSCNMLVGHDSGSRRVQQEQLSKISEGMTIKQAWDALGRPWQIVVDGVGGSREVHQYRMDGEKYRDDVKIYDVEADEYVTETVTLTQPRLIELTFENGLLIKSGR